MRRLTLFVAALVALGVLSGIAGAAPAGAREVDGSRAASGPLSGSYVAVTPFRAADTRLGRGVRKGSVGPGQTLRVPVGGHERVPASGVSAVAVTITAVTPNGVGGLVAYAADGARPATKSVLYEGGINQSAFAIARVSRGGVLAIYNAAARARTQVVVDVSGYYRGGTASTSTSGVLHSLATPRRVVDTRTSRPVAARHTLVGAIGGHAGVPAKGVTAVAVAISVITPSKNGALVAYANGNDPPTRANLQFWGHHNALGFAVVPVNAKGQIAIYNASFGATHIVVDVVGWTVGGVATAAGTLQPRYPYRALDGARLPAHGVRSVAIAGRGGVPKSNVASVMVSVTVLASQRTGGLVVSAMGTRPSVTTLQYSHGRPVTNLALVPVSAGGAIDVRNVSYGATYAYVDIVGFVLKKSLDVPTVSVSRYLGDLTGDLAQDVATMSAHGTHDAASGSTLVLLDTGAQSVSHPELDADNPGVSLANVANPPVRLRYPALVQDIQAYITGFSSAAPGRDATIAVGTNNDGAYDPADVTKGDTYYTPEDRGSDWANQVIDQLAPPAGITVVGANDIEPGFASTQAQAKAWEDAYLKATSGFLVFNGSADGCPDAYGEPGETCLNGWTEQQLYDLAYNKGRVQALPQIYGPSFAAQWANVDATGGGGLKFIGVLTEYNVDPATYTPASGWAALKHALGTPPSTVDIPAVTDLRIG